MSALRPVQRWLVLPALAIGSIVVVLVIIELGVRVLAPGENVAMVELDPMCGWRGTRNVSFVFAQGSVRMDVDHNSQGYRDTERTTSSPAGAERILCCGDSFTWGWGVAQDSVYTRVLEEALLRDGRRVEVINAGVCGRSTVQALVDLRERGFGYGPGTVVYQAAQNDLFGNLPGSGGGLWRKPYYVLEDDGRLTLHDCPVPPLSFGERVKYHAVRWSRLAYLLRHRLRARFSEEVGVAPGVAKNELPGVDYQFELFCAVVRMMHEECLAEGARLVVLIDYRFSDPRRDYWEEHCGDVRTLFIHDYLRDRAEVAGEGPLIPGDGHWTAAAHRWIADYLHDSLAKAPSQSSQTP